MGLTGIVGTIPVQAATLEQLTLDEMTGHATDIVRGVVSSSRALTEGSAVNTHYTIQVQERWKGIAQPVVDLVLPGGAAGGVRQTFAGVPQLDLGRQYVLFLWKGSSGKTQLIGLTQGLFEVGANSAGEMVVSRGPSSELMLDHAGHAVQDQAVNMRMPVMSGRVKSVLQRNPAK